MSSSVCYFFYLFDIELRFKEASAFQIYFQRSDHFLAVIELQLKRREGVELTQTPEQDFDPLRYCRN